MKSGHSYFFTEEQQDKIQELMQITENVLCFQVDGVIYFGEVVEVVKRYVGQNPSDKFIIWLDKNIPHISLDAISENPSL